MQCNETATDAVIFVGRIDWAVDGAGDATKGLTQLYSQKLAMKKFDRIQSNPAILNGQPTILDMRITVRRVVEAVALYPN